jgi:hypothetical protein
VRLSERDRRTEAAGRDIAQPRGGFAAARIHVHVRVGLVAVKQRDGADHGRRDVRVEIERHRHRERADGGAHGLEEIALAVVDALDHHGAVKVQQNTVQPTGATQVREQAVARLRVELLGDAPGGRGGGRQRGGERDAMRGGGRDHAAETGPGVAIGFEQLTAVVKIARLELTASGRDGAERVRLVRQHPDEEPHAAS